MTRGESVVNEGLQAGSQGRWPTPRTGDLGLPGREESRDFTGAGQTLRGPVGAAGGAGLNEGETRESTGSQSTCLCGWALHSCT